MIQPAQKRPLNPLPVTQTRLLVSVVYVGNSSQWAEKWYFAAVGGMPLSPQTRLTPEMLTCTLTHSLVLRKRCLSQYVRSHMVKAKRSVIPTYVLAHLIKVLKLYTDPQSSHRNLIPRTPRLLKAPAPAALFHMCPEYRSRAVSNSPFWGDMSNSPWKSAQASCLVFSVIMCVLK